MPINFPNSPSPNQQYTYDNKTWEWNGIYWEVYSALTSYVTYTTFNSYTATTQPLILNSVTGGTYSGGTLSLINNFGNTIPITGFSTSSSGGTISGDYLPLSGGTVTGGTIFQSGLTANTISATTYLNLPIDVFVTGGTYTSGNAIFTNNTGGTFTVTGFPVGGGGGLVYYLNLSNSQTPYREFSPIPTTATEQSSGVSISNGVTQTIAEFLTPVGYPNATLLPGGIWTFHLHSNKDSDNASFQIFAEVWKRTSGGTETLLFTTDSEPVLSTSPTINMQICDVYFSGTPLLTSDRILAKVRATNTSNQTHTITLFTEGNQHYSYATTTLPTQQGLTCDTLSGCSVIQTIQNNFNSYTATTNPLIYNSITGGTYSGGTLSLINNSGNTIPITGFSSSNNFTGGTVTGSTNFTNGLTANTISATTYQNLPVTADTFVTGFSLNNETITLSQNRVDQYSAFNISLSGYVTNNIFSSYTASTQSTVNNKLDTSGFTAYTATTQPLILNSVTGGTFSGGTLSLINNSGNTIPITGFTTGGGGSIKNIQANFGNGQTVVLSGTVAYIRIPFDVTISTWSIISELSGSVVVDIWRLTNGIPTAANTIIGGGTKPFLSSERLRVSSPTGWTSTALLAGDILAFRVDSCSLITKFVIQLNPS